MTDNIINRKQLLILLVLILVLLGLSATLQVVSSASTKDIVPQFTGDNVAPTATITSFSYTIGCHNSDKIAVTPISYQGVNVYLVPNGANYSIAYSCNSDGFGLAPSQTGVSTGIAPISGCTEVTPQITVHATVQDAPKLLGRAQVQNNRRNKMKESFISKIQVENRVVINKKVYDHMKLQKGQTVRVTIDDSPDLR